MVFVTCPNCNRKWEIDDDNDYYAAIGRHTCECGEEYDIAYDCSDEYDGILVADFFNYNL